MIRIVTISMGAATLALAGPAMPHGPVHPTDPQIAHIAYTAGLIDIAAGKQALAKSRNKTVRAFAREMIRDQGRWLSRHKLMSAFHPKRTLWRWLTSLPWTDSDRPAVYVTGGRVAADEIIPLRRPVDPAANARRRRPNHLRVMRDAEPIASRAYRGEDTRAKVALLVGPACNHLRGQIGVGRPPPEVFTLPRSAFPGRVLEAPGGGQGRAIRDRCTGKVRVPLQ